MGSFYSICKVKLVGGCTSVVFKCVIVLYAKLFKDAHIASQVNLFDCSPFHSVDDTKYTESVIQLYDYISHILFLFLLLLLCDLS